MINFREIFNISYSYIGIIVILLLIVILFFLDKKYGIKVIGYSFLGAGIFLLIVYLFGNMIVSSFNYRVFIEIISDNFFNSIIVYSVISMIFGGINLEIYRYYIDVQQKGKKETFVVDDKFLFLCQKLRKKIVIFGNIL